MWNYWEKVQEKNILTCACRFRLGEHIESLVWFYEKKTAQGTSYERYQAVSVVHQHGGPQIITP